MAYDQNGCDIKRKNDIISATVCSAETLLSKRLNGRVRIVPAHLHLAKVSLSDHIAQCLHRGTKAKRDIYFLLDVDVSRDGINHNIYAVVRQLLVDYL